MIIKKCKFCKEEAEYKSSQSFGSHVSRCTMNPNAKSTIEKIRETRLDKNPEKEYNLNCKGCNEEYKLNIKLFDYNENRYKKFCSKECSAKYSSSFIDDTKTKELPCMECGTIIICKCQSSVVKCEDCKDRKRKSVKTCLSCGKFDCNNEICEKYKIFPTLTKYFGLDKLKIGTSEIYSEYDRVKNNIIEMYIDREMSLPDIKKEISIGLQTMSNILSHLSIPKRNLSESNLNAVKQGKSFNKISGSKIYKNGKYITWDNKEAYYRSSYELEVFKILDMEEIEYLSEELRIEYYDSIKNHNRTAIPDIFIPSKNLIIEIKSPWTYDKINMEDKSKEYEKLGYRYKLLLFKKRKDITLNKIKEVLHKTIVEPL